MRETEGTRVACAPAAALSVAARKLPLVLCSLPFLSCTDMWLCLLHGSFVAAWYIWFVKVSDQAPPKGKTGG